MKKFLLLGAGALLAMSANAQNPLDNYTVDPEDNSVITYASVKITWDDSTEVVAVGDEIKVQVTYGDEPAQEVYAYLYDEGDYNEELEEYVPAAPYYLDIDFSSVTYGADGVNTGKYTVTVPAGVVQVKDQADQTNPQIVLNYTLNGSYGQEEVTPPYGSDYLYNANDLSNVVVRFVNKTSFSAVNNDVKITYELQNNDADAGIGPMAMADEAEGPQNLPENLYTIDAETGTITMDLSGFAEGTWMIEIPAGLVNFDEYTINNSLNLTYVIFNGMSLAKVLSPEYETVVMPGNVELTWDYQTVYATEAGLSATLKYYVESDDPDSWWPEEKTVDVPLSAFAFASSSDEEGGVDNGPGDVPVPEAEDGAASGDVLIIKVSDLLEGVTGNVTLVIPEGIVENEDGLVNPAQSVSFKITPAFEGANDYELTYNEETNALDLTWGEGLWLSINRSAQEAYFLINEELKIETSIYDSFDNPTGDVSLNDTNDTVSFSLNNLTVDGNYTLVIPEAYILIEDNNVTSASLEITYEFNLDAGVFSDGHTVGVSSLNSEFVAPTGVYNLQGVKVGDSIEGLAKGLYIVNGKKVLVK